MGKIKRTLLTLLIGIGALFIINAPVNAADKPQLQQDIENTINTALDEYLSNVDVSAEVNKLIDDTLSEYISGMIESETQTAFEEQLKQEAQNVLMRYLGDTPQTLGTEAVIGLQTIFETALENSTYDSNNQIKAVIKDFILNNLSSKIDTYNDNRIKLYRSSHSDDYDSREIEKYLIKDSEKARILNAVGSQVDLVINIGYLLRNNVLSGLDGELTFSKYAADYVIEHVLEVTDTKALLTQVRNEVKIVAENGLKDRIADSIKSYIVSEAGQSIFTGIKNAIYYYIQENGGLEKIYKEGFNSQTSTYISSEIGDIVDKNIRLALEPYIRDLANMELRKVTEEISEKYVNSSAWQVIVDAINYNYEEIFEIYDIPEYEEMGVYAGANKLRHNLSSTLSSYLANSSIPSIINSNLLSINRDTEFQPSTKATDYVKWTIGEEGVTYDSEYSSYESVGHLILAEIRKDAEKYMETTIFEKIKADAKNTINSYLTGENKAELGDKIQYTFIGNVSDLFITEVVEPLVDNINTELANWISEGIGNKVIDELEKTVTSYLENNKDPDIFTEETGIKLGEILKQVDYKSNNIWEGQISLEDLAQSSFLVGTEKGRIVVPVKNSANPLDDATVELGPILTYEVEVRELNGGNMILVNPYWTALCALSRFFPNPYGTSVGLFVTVGLAGLSRTIADYDFAGINDLTPAEAYVLAHEKHTGYYPDRIQGAYYSVLEQEGKMVPEYDEGIIDKETYMTIRKVFSIVGTIASINWEKMFTDFSNAQNIAGMIMSIDTNLITGALGMAGITLHDLLPFVDPDILNGLAMFGVGLGVVVDWAKAGVASLVGYVETGGQSFLTDQDYFANKVKGAYNAAVDKVNWLWGKITGVKDWITNAASEVKKTAENLNSEVDKLIEKAKGTLQQIKDIDLKLAAENLTKDVILELQDAKARLEDSFYGVVNSASDMVSNLGSMGLKFGSTVSSVASEASKSLIGDLSVNGVPQLTEDLNSKFGSIGGDYSSKWQNNFNIGEDVSLDQLLENLEQIREDSLAYLSESEREFQESLDYFSEENLSSNPRYENSLNVSVTDYDQFLRIVESNSAELEGKSGAEAFKMIQEKWRELPSYDEGRVTSFMMSVASQFGLEVKEAGETLLGLAEDCHLTWGELKDKILQYGGELVDSVKSAFGGGFIRDTFVQILQAIIPSANEITADYQQEEPIAALELADEAMHFKEAVDHWNEFEEAHYGKNFVDLTNYNNVKVSYSKNTDYIYVGPFTVDYVREVYDPVSLYDSELADYDLGNISFSGIVEAELYADDAKTVKITDWEFVYPDKERNMLPSYDKSYEYPYPGEKFYLKLPSQENYSVNTLSRMTFRLARMTADGQTYKLTGDYQQLMWMTMGIPIPCPLTGRCICGIPGGHPLSAATGGYCYPICCPLHGVFGEGVKAYQDAKQKARLAAKKVSEAAMQSGIASDAYAAAQKAYEEAQLSADLAEGEVQAKAADFSLRPPHIPGVHFMGNFYSCFRITVGTGHAQDLEQIRYAKISREYQMEEMEFGKYYNERESNAQKQAVYTEVHQTYHSTNINETNILYNQLRKGNLSINTEEVPNLPFMDNYNNGEREFNYKYFNYPEYPDSPNYPSSPYYPDNENYPDYPSYPYYVGDPRYPYYNGNNTSERVKELDNPVIPLTFHIEGTVWLDNPTGYEAEADGIWDEGTERGIPNVEVILYKYEDPDNYIAKTLTDENGHYEFEYVRVGFDYYVEFMYDGMTYKSTTYLGSESSENTGEEEKTDYNALNKDYKNEPEGYLNYSYAIEDAEERDNFNRKFYEISKNLATADPEIVGTEISYLTNLNRVTYVDETIPLEYQTWYTPNGAISALITTDSRGITLDDFKMSARTLTTDLLFPLNEQYQVDTEDCDMFEDGSDMYIHTYPALENVNMGLVLREQGDLSTKTDLYQIKTVDKNGEAKTYPYNEKEISDELFDILSRNQGYYSDIPYEQEVDPNDYNWRIDSEDLYQDVDVVTSILSLESELDIYLEYKILVKNNGTLHNARVLVLENNFTDDLEYATEYEHIDLTSWIETPRDGSEIVDREEITWEYREGMENGYFTIYTDDLEGKDLAPGEVIELHLILRVKESGNRDKILDGEGDIKTSVTEVHTYSYDEGTVTKSANPGSADMGFTRTYPDSADPAPLLQVVLDKDYDSENSNEITGYVWEDYATVMKGDNNQLIGNGVWDEGEPLIDGVKVELIEVIQNPETGETAEVLRKTASGTNFYYTGQDIMVNGKRIPVGKGQYKFTDLEAGTYKVKFTYGDTYQLSKDLTYNGQDFKTLALDTIYQQYDNKKLEVMILNDTSVGMLINYKGSKMNTAVQSMIDSLYDSVQMARVGVISFSEPAGDSSLRVDLTQKGVNNSGRELVKQVIAQNAVNKGPILSTAITQAKESFSEDADAKVIVILTDGHMQNKAADRTALAAAQAEGIKIISVVCSTDEWDNAIFGEEENPTAGKLYSINEISIDRYIKQVVLEDILLEFENTLPNLTDAKDVETSETIPNKSNIGDVYSRERNIGYSSTMTNENSEVLELENIRVLQAQLNDENIENKDEINAEINKRIATLANNTKVTAISPERNILFSHDNSRTEEVNLGLVERPKLDIRVQEEISRIAITLANGEVIIDTARDLTQNVTIYPEQTVIAMDEEIMQGAKIDIDYIITITNNGQVDTLADYFTYDMFDAETVAYMTRTVPVKIGALNNYYTNLTFRAENNANIELETNSVTISDLSSVLAEDSSLIEKEALTGKVLGNTITPYISKVTTNRSKDGRAIVLKEAATWEDKQTVRLKDKVEETMENSRVNVVSTTSLRDVELFPNISKEVLAGNEAMANGAQTSDNLKFSSINLYVRYTKNLAANDPDDTLLYDNSTEITERLSDVGRRVYFEKTGDYVPHADIEQQDSAKADRITILPPFGDNRSLNYYLIAIASATILGIGIVFIRKKVL